MMVSLNELEEIWRNVWMSLFGILLLCQDLVLQAKPPDSSPFMSAHQQKFRTDRPPLQVTLDSRYYKSYLRSTTPSPYADDTKDSYYQSMSQFKSKLNTNKYQRKMSRRTQRGTLHTFKSSICYDTAGKANIGLRCPYGYNIQTVVAFTALSRFATCSYDAWDCILQEGVTQRCDGRDECSIAATYEESIETMMSCGNHGDQGNSEERSMYFQVEYECISDDGVKAVVSEPETSTTFILLNLEDVVKMNGTIQQDYNDTESVIDDKTALVAILGGTTLGFIILIAVISTCIYRIKSSSTKLEGCQSSRITSGLSSMSGDGAVHTDPELMRQPRRNNFHYDYRRPLDRPQPFDRGFTIWNGRSTTYVENEEDR